MQGTTLTGFPKTNLCSRPCTGTGEYLCPKKPASTSWSPAAPETERVQFGSLRCPKAPGIERPKPPQIERVQFGHLYETFLSGPHHGLLWFAIASVARETWVGRGAWVETRTSRPTQPGYLTPQATGTLTPVSRRPQPTGALVQHESPRVETGTSKTIAERRWKCCRRVRPARKLKIVL